MSRLFYWLTGGRPMIFAGYAFKDVVTGEPVKLWRDHYGRLWFATGPWSAFRMRSQYGPEIWRLPP